MGNGRAPLICQQNDIDVSAGGNFGKLQQIILIAPHVQYDQHITGFHVHHIMRPGSATGGNQHGAGADHLQMQKQIFSECVGDAAAGNENGMVRVCQHPAGAVKIIRIDMRKSLPQILQYGIGKAVQNVGIGDLRRPAFMLFDGVGNLCFQLVTQGRLKCGKAGKAKLLDHARDSRGGNIGITGDFGNAGQARDRPVLHQKHGELPLCPRKIVKA